MTEICLLCSLYVLVVFHGLIVGANILAFFILPFGTRWYEAIPLMSIILLLTFSRRLECPLTRLENYLRRKLGMKRIGGFVGHYFVRPLRRRK